MDQDDATLVKEMVEGDTYFKEARQWYNVKYQSPIVEKAYAIILTSIAVFSTLFSVSGLMGLLPIDREVPFVIVTQEIENDLVMMKQVGAEDAPVDQSLIRHFVHEYVTMRESYDVQVIEQQMNRVRALSSKKAFLKYRKLMTTSNPASPITLYESHTKRELSDPKQRRVRLWYEAPPGTEDKEEPDEEPFPNRASLEFTATVESPESVTRSRWIANFSFLYTPVVVDQDTFEVTPMEFTVTQYNVEKKRTTAK